jgi:hypothetical protein
MTDFVQRSEMTSSTGVSPGRRLLTSVRLGSC